jgi:signal transduction histidine kinase
MTRSAFELGPVLQTIIDNAGRLSNAEQGAIHRFDGGFFFMGASYRGGVQYERMARAQPVPADRRTASGRAVLARRTIHIPDVLADAEYGMPDRQRVSGYRTFLSAPLLRDDTVIGVINLWKTRVEPFTPQEIEMVESFAAQAVIAIDNVTRAETMREALDQQTAIAEILRVINRSTTDVEPVLEAIVEGAMRLCGGILASVYQWDGERIQLLASRNFAARARAEVQRGHTQRLTREESAIIRCVEERVVVNMADAQGPDAPAFVRQVAQAGGYRSLMLAPMIRERGCIGAIGVASAAVGSFTERHVEVLRTFCDQASIAIENARLFQELQARTRALSRSVDELTALAETSQAVSASLDFDTVLTTIVTRATELTASHAGAIYEFDVFTNDFYLRATHGMGEELTTAMRAAAPKLSTGMLGRVAAAREAEQIPDLLVGSAAEGPLGPALLKAGFRSLLCVPLISEGRVAGGLIVRRRQPGAWPAATVALLKTFAAQSALAIQNARLFREIADKSRELEIASRHKSQFLAAMSHELRTPLNAIIGYTELMLEDPHSAEDVDTLERVLRASKHLHNLINDVLDLAKIEAGKMELDLSEFDLGASVEAAVTLVRERASRKQLALTCVVDPHIGRLEADERKVRQVVLNLLSNAVKFTPEQGRISVRVRELDDNVEVSVEDTGVGIAPGDQQTIFDEFRQLGQPGAKAEGTGLGLALSRKFIELHHGTIRVASVPGVGSTFAFTLPR